MKQQNYNNHIRWYKWHHFVLYPILTALTVITFMCAKNDVPNRSLWAMLCIVVFLIGALSFMLRQHYSLVNQNRVVRLELRFRYYVLTQKRFEEVENKLSKGQIYALRFASDAEFPALVNRALKEKLSSDEIKRAIKNWLPDDMRV